jgi:hypothetical protein
MAKKPGPKTIELNWDEFEKLCQIHCTLQEIAGWFKCSPDTIERRCMDSFGRTFREVHAEKSATGKISIRRKQYQLAMEGDKTMLVWLGKQVLGQVENFDFRLKKEEEAAGELTDEEVFRRAREITHQEQSDDEDQG